MNDSGRDYDSSSFLGSLCSNNDSLTPYTDATKCKKVVRHIKRPMNPFMVWSQIERRKIMEHGSYVHNSEVSKQLGQRWKLLSPAERQTFEKEAERLRKLHNLEYPGYKFSPKKKLKSKLSKNADMTSNTPSENESPKIGSQCPNKVVPVKTLGESMHKRKINDKSESDNRVSKKVPNKFLTSKTNIESCIYGDKTLPALSGSKTFVKAEQMNKVKKKFTNNSLEAVDKKHNSIRPEEKKCNYSLADKLLWDSLRETNITSLSIDKTSAADFYPTTSTGELLKSNNLNKKSLPLYVDGCLTSGSIAALACYRDDWAETFDYLTDKVLQSSKNIYEEINYISIQYNDLLKSNTNFGDPLNCIPSELQIPDINKVLGKNWKDPNFGLDFLS